MNSEFFELYYLFEMAKKKFTGIDFRNIKDPEELKKILIENGGLETPDSDSPIMKHESTEIIDDDDDDDDESLLVTQKPQVTQYKAQEVESSIGMKSKMIGGKCAIELESSGRFSVPYLVYFGDYDVDDVGNVALSREEDILQNIVNALNKQKAGDWDVEEMTLEEFYESLVSIKYRFASKIHNHRWMCDCQSKYPENQRKLSEMEVDLSTIRYIAIEESEEKIRENYKLQLENIDDTQFSALLMRRYGEVKLTREQEIERLKLKEPIMVTDDDKSYIFRLVRVKDMLKAMELSQKKFNWKIRQRRNDPIAHNANNQDELMARKDEEILKLEHEKAKFTIKAMKAMTLLSFNGNEISDLEDKLSIFGAMSKTALFKFGKFMENAKFGIHDERDFTCNFCQKTEKRLLQRAISPIELFPTDDTDKSGSGRISQFDPGFDVYIVP